MNAGTIVNATGSDTIRVWYMDHGRISYRDHRNRSWIFVSGDMYDLAFLARQLDESGIFGYSMDTMRNVHGEIEGIRVPVWPSGIRDLNAIINSIGMERKFSIYNGDIDPVLRFMAERNLGFFTLENPMDPDPEIPVSTIVGRSMLGVPYDIEINGRHFPRIDSDAIYEAYRAITQGTIIVYSNRDGFFRKILQMILHQGYGLPRVTTSDGSTFESYGQTHYSNPRVSIDGKICIESDSFAYSETGIHGLIEISRTSGLPIVTASRVTTGTAVSSMEEAYAVRSGVLIPVRKDDHEEAKSAETLLNTDSGGLVLQPDPGIYTDVHEIDFSSMYPSIMVRYNLSPETLQKNGAIKIHGTPYSTSGTDRGFLASALDGLLQRRLFYKSVKARSGLYGMRDAALKWMLLTSFGYTGYKNAKFGKIEIHESITAMGRWALAMAMNIARANGFTPIHGIVDSLWISGSGDVGKVLSQIQERTGIGIVEDGHYRWIVFMPANSGLGALNMYIGLRMDETVKVRGLYVRRRDIPPVCKNFQWEAIEFLRSCMTPEDIWAKRKEIMDLEARYVRSLRHLPLEDFRIPLHVTRNPEEYAVHNIQGMAIKEAVDRGYRIMPGSRIGVVVVDHHHGIVDLDGTHDGIDLKFYERQLSMAFRQIGFIVRSCSPRTKQADLFSFSV